MHSGATCAASNSSDAGNSRRFDTSFTPFSLHPVWTRRFQRRRGRTRLYQRAMVYLRHLLDRFARFAPAGVGSGGEQRAIRRSCLLPSAGSSGPIESSAVTHACCID